LQNGFSDGGGDESAGTDLHELAARQGIFGHRSFSPSQVLKRFSATDVYAAAEIIYGEELSHSGRRFSKTIFFSMAEVVPILGLHSQVPTARWWS
jgi:hypothetical protein